MCLTFRSLHGGRDADPIAIDNSTSSGFGDLHRSYRHSRFAFTNACRSRASSGAVGGDCHLANLLWFGVGEQVARRGRCDWGLRATTGWRVAIGTKPLVCPAPAGDEEAVFRSPCNSGLSGSKRVWSLAHAARSSGSRLTSHQVVRRTTCSDEGGRNGVERPGRAAEGSAAEAERLFQATPGGIGWGLMQPGWL